MAAVLIPIDFGRDRLTLGIEDKVRIRWGKDPARLSSRSSTASRETIRNSYIEAGKKWVSMSHSTSGYVPVPGSEFRLHSNKSKTYLVSHSHALPEGTLPGGQTKRVVPFNVKLGSMPVSIPKT
jgi:hypothetical protein